MYLICSIYVAHARLKCRLARALRLRARHARARECNRNCAGRDRGLQAGPSVASVCEAYAELPHSWGRPTSQDQRLDVSRLVRLVVRANRDAPRHMATAARHGP